MTRALLILALAASIGCLTQSASAQDIDPLLAPIKRQVRPVASVPSQTVQRAMPPSPVLPPTKAKPKPVQAADVKAWQPTVVATGLDNPAVTSGGVAPSYFGAPGEIRTEPRSKGTPPRAAVPARIITSSSEPHAEAVSAAVPVAGDVIGSEGQQYCSNIIDIAADQRFAWQKQVVSDLGRDLEERIKLLEKKTAEYKEWLAKRDDFVNRATGNLVKIYARMKPDAAAAQLTQLDEETAAAVLSKLEPKATSTILNEMDPKRAALLTGIIAGAARLDPEGRKS